MSDAPASPYGRAVPLPKPNYVVRNLERGTVDTLSAIPALAALAGRGIGVPGSDTVLEGIDTLRRDANDRLGTFTATYEHNPYEALLQTAGGALVPGIGVGAKLAQYAPKTAALIESVLPFTNPFTPARIGANAVGGAAVEAGMEAADHVLREGAPARAATPWRDVIVEGTGTAASSVAHAVAETPTPQEEEKPWRDVVVAGTNAAPAQPQPQSQPQRAEPNLDLAVRTVLAEAGNQGYDGLAGVAHVINRRAQLTGMTLDQVVQAKNQFEPWNTADGQKRMMSVRPDSPAYQRALSIVRGVVNDEIPDPTNGATHFYAPVMQRDLGRNTPRWAQGLEGTVIGGHTFYSRPQDFGGRGVQLASAKPTALPVQAGGGGVGAWRDVTVGPDNTLSPTVDPNDAPRGLKETIADLLLPGALALGSGYAVGRSAGQVAARRAASDAAANTLVHPGSPRNPQDYVPTTGEHLANEHVDEGTILRNQINEAAKAGVIKPEYADLLHAQVDVYANKTPRAAQAAEVSRSGILHDNTRVGRPLTEITDELGAITAADPAKGLRIQEAAIIQNELANRLEAVRTMKGTTVGINPATGAQNMVNARTIDPATGIWQDVPNAQQINGVHTVGPLKVHEPARVGLTDQSWDQLHTKLEQLQQDPDVMRFQQEFKDRAARWRRYTVRHGYFEQREVMRMEKRNPFYMPTIDPDDVSGNHVTRRTIEEDAAPFRGQDLILSWQDYEKQMTEVVVHNNAKRQLAEFLRDWQKAIGPNGDRIVGDIHPVGSPGDRKAQDGVTFKQNGKRVKLDVYVPEIAAVMRNDPKNVTWWLNGFRQTFQFFTTGPGALVLGNPFAVGSAIYNGTMAHVRRPDGTKFGLIGFRGDPTSIGLSIADIVRNTAAASAREVGRALRGSKQFGATADWLTKHYEDSIYHELNKFGGINTGGIYGGDYSSRNRGNVGALSATVDATRPIVQGAPRDFGEKIDTYFKKWGVTLIPAEARKTWQLIKEFNDIVANSPNSAFYRQNIDAYADKFAKAGLGRSDAARGLTRHTRQLGADPSISGANQKTQQAATAFPYVNITLQGIATFVRSARQNPGATLTAVTALTVPYALMQMYSAQEYDEYEHARGRPGGAVMDMLAGSVNSMIGQSKVYLPGLPISAAFSWPLEPVMGMFHNIVTTYGAKLWGMDDPNYHGIENEQKRRAFRRMIESRDSRTLWESIKRAGAQIALPPPVDAALRMGGVDARTLLSPGGNASELGGRTARGYETGTVPNDPMALPGAMPFAPDTPRHFLEAMGGGGGSLAVMYLRTLVSVLRDTGSPSAAFKAVGTQWMQNATDRIPGGPALWGQGKTTFYDVNAADASEVSKKLSSLQTVMQNIARHGTTGAGGYTQVEQEGPGRPQMPRSIIGPVQQFSQLAVEIRGLQQAADQVKDDIKSLRGNGVRLASPTAVRARENELNDKVRKINTQIMELVYAKEHSVSLQTGRQVRLLAMDPHDPRGVEQFSVLD